VTFVTFAITGLEPSELKGYIPVDEKIHKLESMNDQELAVSILWIVSLSLALALI
jgi:hypothetical protein